MSQQISSSKEGPSLREAPQNEAFIKEVRENDATGKDGWQILLDRYRQEKSANLDTSDTVIQTLWFADYLARRRQNRLGVTFSETYNNGKNVVRDMVAQSKDGRCTRTELYTDGKRTRLYTYGEQKIRIAKRRATVFSVLRSEEQKSVCKCPNCGSESKVEDCMNGCPFCGTKFRLTSYLWKIAGEHDNLPKFNPVLLLVGLSFLVAVIAFINQYFTRTDTSTAELIINSVFAGAALGILFYIMLQIPIGIYFIIRIFRDNRLSDLCKKIRRTDPLFSTEEFAADLNARVKAYFLSDQEDKIGFVSGLQPGQHSTVVDVNIDSYRSLSTGLTPHFQLIRAEANLQFVLLENGRLLVRKKLCQIDLYRAPGILTELRTEKEIFTCPSCGNFLSILEGGLCSSCGRTTDLSRFGWVLGAVTEKK